MKKSKVMIASTLVFTLAVGSVLWLNMDALAAEVDGSKPESSESVKTHKIGERGGQEPHHKFGERAEQSHGMKMKLPLEELTALLGLTDAELGEALRSGQSLADIAAAQDVEVQQVIDLHVAAMTERLDQQLADGKLTQEQYDARLAELPGKAEEIVNSDRPLRPAGKGHLRGGGHDKIGERGGGQGHAMKPKLQLEELTALLGLSEEELGEALRSGQSLADIATAQDVAVQQIIDLHVATMTERLDQQLADGKLTQEQYDDRLAELPRKAEELVNSDRPFKAGGKRGMPVLQENRAEQTEEIEETEQSV